MNILLIIALIYCISVVILHIIAYIYWSYHDDKGSTLIDMYNYIHKETDIFFTWFWIPFCNTMLVVGLISGAIFFGIVYIISLIFSIIINGFFRFIGKFSNIKIK